ncbi:transposase [Ammoniphilus resinae]|uniref:DNA-directed RNA polymerase subunit RPC12/RpoP n=1 Tax=Ammoniphilus resinae TaxID=861532 RepID=A0ABS4GVS5_9BACL|nr:transposase [Ammoniphilus resinae]MBP1934364.1 DNA-directed RNA polymerase subunit RPC12/RpoP [Ammoniphilus resinae]
MVTLTLDQFQDRFHSEDICADYLFHMKWPHGFVCPKCSHRHYYLITTRRLPLYECAQCSHQTSLTVGTIMEGSPTPLQKWFTAIFLASRPSPGINAVQLKEIIQVTYKTSWLILQKIRRAMSESDATHLLSGMVQVHDACYGHPYNIYHQTHPKEHFLLVGTSLNEQKQPSYIKMKLLMESPREKLISTPQKKSFAERYIEAEDSDVEYITQRLKPRRLKIGYPYFKKASQWLNETFHGIGIRHLQAYLDEFCYRVNQALDQAPLFQGLIQLCAATKKANYWQVTRRRRKKQGVKPLTGDVGP